MGKKLEQALLSRIPKMLRALYVALQRWTATDAQLEIANGADGTAIQRAVRAKQRLWLAVLQQTLQQDDHSGLSAASVNNARALCRLCPAQKLILTPMLA